MKQPHYPSCQISRFLPAMLLFTALTLTLNGCTVKHPVSRPTAPTTPPKTAPVKTKVPSYPTRPATPAQPSIPQVPSQPTPSAPTTAYTPRTGQAGALYASAREAVGQGDYQQAEMALERALKIEPRNPHYWYSMAQIKYKQKQFAQTIHLCSKSKSFAGKDEQLRQLNDALSAQAQQQLAH